MSQILYIDRKGYTLCYNAPWCLGRGGNNLFMGRCTEEGEHTQEWESKTNQDTQGFLRQILSSGEREIFLVEGS